jgi:hypothetical protein
MFFMDNRGYRGFSYHYKIHRAGKQGIDLFHPKNIPLIFPSTRHLFEHEKENPNPSKLR